MSERPVLYADRHPGKPGRWICSGCSVDLFGPEWLCPTPKCKYALQPPPQGAGETGSASQATDAPPCVKPFAEQDMEIAVQSAAQAWCEEKTKQKIMDTDLAYAFARILANWIGSAREYCSNMEYYRGLLDDCVKHLGKAVFVCDDGSECEHPLRAKIPELVGKLAAPQAPAVGAEVSSALDYFGSIVADSSDDDYQDGLRHMAVIRAALAAHPVTQEEK